MSTTNAFNTQPQDATTGKQQQPGYLEQVYNLAAKAAGAATGTGPNISNSTAGPTDTTTNHRNQQPHVGGVDDMGTNRDADVARLPEERANPNPFSSGGASESLENPNITNPSNIQQRLNARDPPNPYPEGNAGVGHSSDKQFRNKQDHVGGVGDLGTKSDADVVRLPEERANPDPLASKPGDTNPFRDTTSGAATGFAASRDRDRDRDTTDAMDVDKPQSHGWKPDQKSWDTRNVVGTMHDPTQHGHSGGMTGSNIDNDHGLGMPHRVSTERGNRDEGAIGQHTNIAGATDFNSGRDAGFKADTRDQGVNERTQAPVGVDTTSGQHRNEGDRPFERSQAPFGTETTAGQRHRDDRHAAKDRTDERTHALAGVDTTSGPRHHEHRNEGDRPLERTQPPFGTDTTAGQRHRDDRHAAKDRADERTPALVGVDTTSGPRHHEHGHEADRPFERSQAPFERSTDTTAGQRHREDRDAAKERADERTHAPAGVDTTSPLVRQDRHEEAEERHDEDDTASPTGKTPSKLDKLHGKIMVAKGKLTKDPEAIAQGQRLQTEGVAIRPSDILEERRD